MIRRRAAAASATVLTTALAALAALASACIGPGDFRCTTHTQCTLGGQEGFCEANGHCSAGDDTCLPSHRRYVHRAGDDADACVPRSCDGNGVGAFSAGTGHACVARADGSLWCWGRNDRGQLGDGTHTHRAVPVRVAGVSGVSAIAAGDAHTCVATATGVFCWGADDLGQLGDGGGDDRVVPVRVDVTGVTGAGTLAAGRDFSCAVVAGGAVSCWGDDSVGQLGDGQQQSGPRRPTPVAGLADVKSVSALWQHACAVTRTSKLLRCWGANSTGQIGDGTTAGPRPPTLVNDPSAATPLPGFDAVAAGRDHTCALAADGLYCWGANAQGQVNPGEPGQPIPTPTPVPGEEATDPLHVAAGAQHTCVIRTSGTVACWGSNTSGQLGSDMPLGNATDIVAGAAFSCATADDGAVYCWGDNHFGQLGIGADTVRATPEQVPGLTHVGAIAAGGAHTCAAANDADGAPALFCWGANGSGQVGNGTLTDVPAPTRISSPQPTGITAGGAHTCAFAGADGQLRCWGWGAAGQLGLNPGLDMVVTTPALKDLVPPEGGDGVYAIAAGAQHTCVAATISASVLCFGLDVDGQLGDDQMATGGPDPVPSFLNMGTDKVTALAAGEAHTCVVDAKGAIWCWGRGNEGQLGDGADVEHPTPTRVALDADGTLADAVTAGAAHTCALADGKVLCWGRNAEGQLGALRPVPLLVPQLVMGLGPVRAVAAGGHHTCAIDDAAATVSCWGANESGQLGNGDTASSNIPVAVTGLTDVDGIVAGGAHSCAHRKDGTVWCWGANTAGQLGDAVTLTSPRPLLARVACQ